MTDEEQLAFANELRKSFAQASLGLMTFEEKTLFFELMFTTYGPRACPSALVNHFVIEKRGGFGADDFLVIVYRHSGRVVIRLSDGTRLVCSSSEMTSNPINMLRAFYLSIRHLWRW